MSFKNEEILQVKYFSYGASGSGQSAADPAAIADGDIMAIQDGSVIEGVQVVVTQAITGTSPEILVGDDDDNDGFAAAADVTEGSLGVYSGAGAYLAAGAKKYYASSGKEVKLDVTGTFTAGKFVVVVKGYRV